jgi:hypothetical protein
MNLRLKLLSHPSNPEQSSIAFSRFSDSQALPPVFAPPLSFSITAQQLAWLDARRANGSLSRSAALRQALDTLISLEAQAPNPNAAQPVDQ